MPLKPLVPLCLAGFAGFLNVFGMQPFFVAIAGELDTTVSTIGYIVTAGLLTTAVAGLIIGPLSERIGIRRTLVAGLIVAAVSALLAATAMTIPWLTGSRLLGGVGASVTGGVTVAAAALIYTGRERQRALAIVTASIAMAVVIGIFIMTTLAELGGWRGAYLILSGFLIVTAFLNRIMLRPDQPIEPTQLSGIRMLINAYQPIISHPGTRRLLLATTLQPAVINGATAYVGALLISQHGVSTQLVGLVFSLIGATYFVGNLIAGNLITRAPHIFVSCGVLIMGIFWALGYLLTIPPIGIAASFGAATFAGGISWVVLLGMIADRTPGEIGTTMVLSSSTLSLGGAFGTAASAALLDLSGYSGIAFGVIIAAIAAALVAWVPDTDRDVPDPKSFPATNPARYGVTR
jgi:MFS transporter, DHA1 family, inner membrane transport protein